MTDTLNATGDSILLEDDVNIPINIDFSVPGAVSPDLEDPDEYARGVWGDKKKKAISLCGYQKMVEVPNKGTIKIDQWFCGEPECKWCGPKTREDMRLALETHLQENGGYLRKVTLTGTPEEQKAQRAKLVRKYSKGRVSVFVSDTLSQTGDWGISTEVLIKTQDLVGEKLESIDQGDLERWATKSFRHAKSGTLHKTANQVAAPAPDPKDPEPVNYLDPQELIEYEVWIVDCKDKRTLEVIETQALEETGHLNPQTLDELVRDLRVRREVRKRLLEEAGYVILSHESLSMYIKESQIEWKPRDRGLDSPG